MTPAVRAAVIGFCLVVGAFVIAVSGCRPAVPGGDNASRLAAVPGDVPKGQPGTDPWPPVLQVAGWHKPVPLEGPINTAGAEDSAYITWDGRELYFFFANDVRLPAEVQVRDRAINGIWRSTNSGGGWTPPERVFLAKDLALDGCQVIHGDVMWFGSGRAGNFGEVDVYTATRRNGVWGNWQNAGRQLNMTWNIDEFHIMPGGETLYFAATFPGGHGGQDIWVATRTGKSGGDPWGDLVNLGPAVNGPGDQAQPFVSNDGKELWFTANSTKGYPGPAVWRSVRGADGSWGRAVEVVSSFAGEPCLDARGDIYFVHHYFSADLKRMIEADIYVARKK